MLSMYMKKDYSLLISKILKIFSHGYCIILCKVIQHLFGNRRIGITEMSNLQWLGIWGMTGFSKPENKDLDKWSKGITYLLEDPKGVHYYEEFLMKRDGIPEDKVEILRLWKDCDDIIKQGKPEIFENERQKILDGAEKKLNNMSLNELSQVDAGIKSRNKAQIRNAVTKVQEEARDELRASYDAFIKHLQELNSSKEARCLIL